MIPLLGLIIGLIIGILIPYNIPREYSNYAAVAILAALDSVFGGLVASMENRFKTKVFLSGFLGTHCWLHYSLTLVIDSVFHCILQLYLPLVTGFS